ncbi:hypothetical protein ABL849_23325 [Variovorax sp. 375MFSha3.1]|uniref:hypothetical protein n=1 Tax=Variovorax sp. 375MFSha3.1 TaxID=3158364 RepID=UPI003AAD6E8B
MSLIAGCVVQPPATAVRTVVQPAHVAVAAPPVVSVYVDPPLYQPPAIAVAWAPPPMLVEVPPPSPFVGAVWTGGYWTWHGNWVWAAGRWSAPPQPGYAWVQPYYEHRDNVVVFVAGHWSPPGVAFVPPPLGLSLAVSIAAAGVVAGIAPIGPPGVFVPAPPGSRPGLIVPAPIGTPPAVVVSAPPVTNVGMRVQNTTINNVTNNTTVNNITNVTNITNNNQTVKVVAPASATASGRPFEAAIPASAHLAAALPPVVHSMAPVPASPKPIAALPADHQPPAATRGTAGRGYASYGSRHSCRTAGCRGSPAFAAALRTSGTPRAARVRSARQEARGSDGLADTGAGSRGDVPATEAGRRGAAGPHGARGRSSNGA